MFRFHLPLLSPNEDATGGAAPDTATGGVTPDNAATPPAPPVKTYTEDEYRQAVSGQYNAGLSAALKALGHGVSKGTDVNAKLAELKKLADAQKDDPQKLADAIEDARAKDAENAELRDQLTAVTLGVKPDSIADVVALARTRVKDGTDIKAAMQQVIEAYPQFKTGAETPPPIPGAPNPPPAPPTGDQTIGDKLKTLFK